MIHLLTNIQITIVAVLFMGTFIFGIVLKNMGYPYNSFWFNVHKLISLGFVGFVGYYFFKHHLLDKNIGFTIISLFVLLLTVALIVTGGMLNIEKHRKPGFTILHRFGSVLFVAGFFYLMLAGV